MTTLHAISVFLLLAGSAAAQFTIGNLVNAGSRTAGSGIAQGALFAVTGKGVGVDPFQQATFPLPTTAGLGGVTVQASVGGATVDCIIVSVAANEVDAILPSSTPIGTGTLTVNNNGATATKAINVVAAAFGIFQDRSATHGSTALAFNVNADGSIIQNTNAQSVQPGQDVLINGTGLGAITSDETQSGVTDVPVTTIQVYAGVVPATVVSAGRGLCCSGLDPSYPIPQGIAAWDVIRVTIPPGVSGCFIPVVVQIGASISNLATISIDPSGSACTPAVSTLPPDLTQQLANQTGIAFGAIDLSRSAGVNVTQAGVVNTTLRDTGSATFLKYLNVAASMFSPDYKYPENVCQINGFPGPNGGPVLNGVEAPIVPLKSVSLDAGPTITVSGPSGTRSIARLTAGMIFDYRSVTFGNTTPGNYFDPGHYTVTGPGGKDAGAISTSFDVPPAPFVWTNTPSVTTPLDRSKDLTVNWTGGIPGTQVVVEGATLAGGVTGAFLCAASVDAGTITVPSWVLMALSPNPPPAISGSLSLANSMVKTFTVSGLDYTLVRFSSGKSLSLRYQ